MSILLPSLTEQSLAILDEVIDTATIGKFEWFPRIQFREIFLLRRNKPVGGDQREEDTETLGRVIDRVAVPLCPEEIKDIHGEVCLHDRESSMDS